MNSKKEVLLHHLSELKSSVESSVASLFTKDDMLNILHFIECKVDDFEVSQVEPKQEPSEKQIIEVNPYSLPKFKKYLQTTLSAVVDALQDESVVDSSQFDYEIVRGNEIEVSNIEADKDYILNKIWDALEKSLKTFEA